MKKDFVRKSNAARKVSGVLDARGKNALLFLFLFVVIIIAGFLVYQHKKQSLQFPMVSSYWIKMKNWVAERKSNLHQDKTKVKQIADKNSSNQQIHFEFYTTLPNMQVTVADAKIAPPPVPSLPTKKTVVNTAIFDADKLQSALKDEFKENQYVLQLGVFNVASAAERYLELLAKKGFSANMIKVTISGRDGYRIQLGPFVNKEQVRLTQHKLREKNINSIVRKQENK